MLPAKVIVDGIEDLQLPDLRRLERMPFLPAWVASRVDLLKTEERSDLKTRTRRAAVVLPAKLILTVGQRKCVERYVGTLRAFCAATPANDGAVEQETLRAVSELMLVLPSPAQNELSVEARGEAFMDALDDVPSWQSKTRSADGTAATVASTARVSPTTITGARCRQSFTASHEDRPG